MSAVSQPKTIAVPHSVHIRSGQSAWPSRHGGCSTTRSARQPGQYCVVMTRRSHTVPTKSVSHAVCDDRRVPADSAFLLACRGEPVPHPPVWFMRQAGRSLPEYRKIREGLGMLESCLRPDVVVEVTLQPVRRYGVDAAILFSDIVLPVKAAGVDLDIKPGVGPVVAEPVRTRADVDRIPALEPAQVEPVAQAVRALVGELGSTPLIGFAGAPFTLASYLVEGGPSREHARTKALMYGDEDTWHRLADRLAHIALEFLRIQVANGARAIQLFDSWAGALSAADYERYVLPHSRTVLDGIRAVSAVPRIHFGVGTGELLGLMAAAGADVVGVDWRVPLDEAVRRLPAGVAVQGNLDPAAVFAPWPVVEARTLDVLRRGAAASGHVFNLGHGVLPDTDPDVLARVVDLVHGTP
jgi:uroporphyrinogen decarboxylase